MKNCIWDIYFISHLKGKYFLLNLNYMKNSAFLSSYYYYQAHAGDFLYAFQTSNFLTTETDKTAVMIV